ncbi:TPA: MrcB family domain-containing protein [Staphylococcus aureus]
MIDNFMQVLKLIKEKRTNNVVKKSDWDKGDLYKTLVHDKLPKQLKVHIKEDKYSVVGKVATGNYSKVPWISIYDENITKETKDGYYLVYLFHPEGEGIYLSLNQGWSKISDMFPRDKNAAKQRALTLSSELNKYITSNEFNTGRFYYAENKDSSYDLKNDYPSGYSHGSIRFKYYDLNEGFTEDMLEDLKKFLELFNELASKVTKTSYDSLVNSIDEIQEDSEIEEIRTAQKDKTLKEVEAPKGIIPKYKKGVSKTTKNDSEIEKSNKENKLTGKVGEKLALNYFNELIDNKIDEDKKEQFRNILNDNPGSQHGHGYDLVAFDPTNTDKAVEKFIEIKTSTSSSIEEPFFMSLNEMFAMKEYKQKYLILRIFNVSGKEPQFYFIDPYANYSEFKDVDDLIDKVFNVEAIQYKVFGEK